MSEMVNIQEILKHLPHRFPFILIDRVLSYTPGEKLTAIKNVTINEPFFTGHFPGQPIMPGVLILEALAQASVMLAHYTLPPAENKKLLHLFAGVENARFKQMVIPGDQLTLEVNFLGQKRGVSRMAAQALVDGKLACSATLISAAKEVPRD